MIYESMVTCVFADEVVIIAVALELEGDVVVCLAAFDDDLHGRVFLGEGVGGVREEEVGATVGGREVFQPGSGGRGQLVETANADGWNDRYR